MILEDKLKTTSIIIATHFYTTGPSQDLRDYLVSKKTNCVLFIQHPLFYSSKLSHGSGYSRYVKGIRTNNYYSVLKRIPTLIKFFKEFTLNIFWIFISKKRWDLFIGVDNLNAFSGLVLRSLGIVDKVVYYVIDYNPHRFGSIFLNTIYHIVDKLCARYCDETWNLSERMVLGRKEYFNFEAKRQEIVPVGVWIDRIPMHKAPIYDYSMVFVGHILEKQGLQYVIDAVPLILKKYPKFKLKVIGDGPYLPAIKVLVSSLGLSKEVEFLGYIEDHKEVENVIAKCSLGCAIYDKYISPDILSFTYFADAGKVKLYLGCGIPVLLTDVPYIAKNIHNKRYGRIVTKDSKDIAKGVFEVFEKYSVYKDNVIAYRKDLSWDIIFSTALLRVFKDQK
jgi:glycosyltransferase involved in cell wall biosynthesis